MTLPRETGSEKYEAVCFNCGGPCPTVETAYGSLSAGPCPKCFPSPQKAAEAPLSRTMGTSLASDNAASDVENGESA